MNLLMKNKASLHSLKIHSFIIGAQDSQNQLGRAGDKSKPPICWSQKTIYSVNICSNHPQICQSQGPDCRTIALI